MHKEKLQNYIARHMTLRHVNGVLWHMKESALSFVLGLCEIRNTLKYRYQFRYTGDVTRENNAFWEECEPKAPVDLGSHSSQNAFSSIVTSLYDLSTF